MDGKKGYSSVRGQFDFTIANQIRLARSYHLNDNGSRRPYEACIGGYQYPISLEVNRKVSHISLSKLENIPIINFPEYPISLEVNKNIS